jgi:hypothetical protein
MGRVTKRIAMIVGVILLLNCAGMDPKPRWPATPL